MYRFLLSLFTVLLVNFAAKCQVVSFEIDESAVDTELAAKLDSLLVADQTHRNEYVALRNSGAPGHLVDSLARLILETDRSNLAFVESLLDSRGWPGPQDVGITGSQAVFLIIQHAGLQTQKKYFPMVKQAEREGKILSRSVALLEDRIAVREGRAQTYGTQGRYDRQTQRTYVYPLADPDNLDSLRAAMGLPPMKEYVRDWDPEEYKEYLPVAMQYLEQEAARHR